MFQAINRNPEALKIKAIENVPQALTLIDLQGKRLWANNAFCELLGKPLEALLGTSVELAYPPEEQERVKRALVQETLQSGGVSNFETWFEKNSKKVWVKISTSLIKDESGNPTAIVYSASDITHIKHLHEEKENALGALYESIVELSPDAVVMATPDGHIRMANKSTLEMLGRADRVFEWIDFEDQEKHKRWIEDVVKKDHGDCPGHELTLRARNGEVRNVILHHGLSRFPEDNSPCVIFYIKDITELKAQQSYVNDLLSLLPVGSFSFDIKTGQVYSANPFLQDLLGFTEEELCQKTPFDFLPDEFHASALEHIVTTWRAKGKDWFQYPVITRNGDKISALINYGRVYDPCIKKDIVVAFLVDVSESERTKAKMDMFLSLSPVAICEWRPGGELLSINEQFARMVGYTAEEVYATGWKNLTASEYQGDPDRLHEENALKGTDKTYRKEYIHKDGHRVPIYLVTEPIFKQDGVPDYYISFIQDLTPIVERERLIDTVLETIPIGLVIGDSSGRLHLVNGGYARLAGKKKEELLEQGWMNLTAQEDARRTKEVLERIEDGTSDEEVVEKTYIREDGTKRITQNTYRPIEHKGRRAAVCCAMDITSLKEAREKLEELVEAQQRTIKELSTPIIPIWTKVTMAPLLGSFDSMRMHDLSERLLEHTSAQKSKVVLLDLTGLAYVDTQVISEIVRLIISLRLLGARVVLVGINPRTAQSLVRLGANLEGVPAYATLEQGLKGVIGNVGHA